MNPEAPAKMPPFCLTHQDKVMVLIPGLIVGTLLGFVCTERHPDRPQSTCGETATR